MKCSVCASSGETHQLSASTTSYLGRLDNGNYVIIENVPCLSCPNCGEEYFSASVAAKIDKILRAMEKSLERVQITDFAGAA